MDKNDFENEFKSPSSWYRGTPFWSWNCKLDEKILEEQIPIFREMGFGGFYSHVRTGLDTEYLGEEFFSCIKKSVDLAEKNGIRAWIYDEDRWASGSAGGLVTKQKEYRQKYLLFTPFSYEQKGPEPAGRGFLQQPCRSCEGVLLARYDVQLDDKGCLKRYSILKAGERAADSEWFAYLETARDNEWYNNQTYSDTLKKEAVECFVHITYDKYKSVLKEKIGKEVPAFFTDEPQFSFKHYLPSAKSKTDVTMPWTDDLEESFLKKYGYSLLERLPEVFWELPEQKVSECRYEFHNHIADRFVEAYFQTISEWAKQNHVHFTGHLMEEPSLQSQTKAVGDAMRAYPYMDIPGIDMLRYDLEYTTVKQAQSVAHQYAREGLTGELYGVTGWDCDFRDYKFCGDWQAALGVIHRVPHLAWMSMEGEAKRDFPASIFYQSPWYKEYHYIEDHFARVAVAMTQGKPCVRIGVIHPVESFWLHCGPDRETLPARKQMDDNFLRFAEWMLLNTVDFDYISEALIPELQAQNDGKMMIGAMTYELIIVPGCETLRSSTVAMLKEFLHLGGKVLFLGSKPVYQDGKENSDLKCVFDSCETVPFVKNEILKAVKPFRDVEIETEDGQPCESLIYQLREDGKDKWAFFARGTVPYSKDISGFQKLRIRIKGDYIPFLCNTQNGDIVQIPYSICGEWTEISYIFYEYDSLLLKLKKNEKTDYIEQLLSEDKKSIADEMLRIRDVFVREPVTVSFKEPNVVLLDRAEFSLDDGRYEPEEEILRIDNMCRGRLGLSYRGMAIAQPWTSEKQAHTHILKLRICIESEYFSDQVFLALEKPEEKIIIWNGEKIVTENESYVSQNNYYVDKSIQTVSLPSLVCGKNILEIIQPFGADSNTEWMYLLGQFSVRLYGTKKRILPPEQDVSFGSIVNQGYPFYGGELVYKIPFQTYGGRILVKIPHYRSGLLKVSVDGGEEQAVIYPPYECTFAGCDAGEHILKIRAFVSRNNAFGPVHMADRKEQWFGPSAWRTEGDAWTEGYILKEEGILSVPVIKEMF
ncbi:MAG: glycosyl hydrolase [Candidatus Choladocola sp.]|nr:glycosyl hydrolase [Candidatus Choladocola sp.]